MAGCNYCDMNRPVVAVLADADRRDPDVGDHIVRSACEKHINRLKQDGYGTPFSLVLFRTPLPDPYEDWCDACGGGACQHE